MSIPSSFGVSATSGVLASWLGTTTSSANAASILGGSSTSSGGALTALQSKSSSTVPSTAQALEGLLKPSQQRVIAAVGDNGGPLSIPWNANGTEPTTVAALRTAGWLKLDQKVLTNGKSSGGTYELTKLGTAIYNRTGGGKVGSPTTALTSADTNGTTSTTSSTTALQSAVSSLTSILGSVGVTV
jgi:hypothetical protein